MRRGIAVILVILALATSLDAAHTCCRCHYQNEFGLDGAVLGIGCAVWLLEQRVCQLGEIREETYSSFELPEFCEGGTLKLGYIGHWGSVMTPGVVQNQLIPVAQKYDVKIEYENTACDVLSNAEYIQRLLNEHNDLDIEVRASQVETVGLGDKMIMPQTRVSSKLDKPIYPPCDQIAENQCMNFLHRSEKMKCDDHGITRTLGCCKKTVTREYRDSNHITPSEIKVTDWFWSESCR